VLVVGSARPARQIGQTKRYVDFWTESNVLYGDAIREKKRKDLADARPEVRVVICPVSGER